MSWRLDIIALTRGFASGEVTPSAAAAACLDRIEALDPTLNAFSARADDVRDAARAATDRWRQGAPLGPLDGVPVIVNDNLVSRGLPAAWGNAELARRVAKSDERPVAALRRAGALILGKGNTPEFAVEGYTDNLTFGPTRNPFDPRLTPGGSSGGVVAAVAAGLATFGIGTDGGGSIRRPAGYTGLYGLKPGIGHVPRGGGLPQVLLDFETVGPITRSLDDLRLVDAVLSGLVPEASTPAACRILAVERMSDAPCDPAIREAFHATADVLRRAGHEVTFAGLPHDLGPMNAGWSWIGEIGLAHLMASDPAVAAAAAPKYREMAARGAGATGADLYAILERVFALREAARDLWGFDAVLMPTSAAHPWPATESHPAEIDGIAVGPRGHAVYTGWVNAAGLPAIAFPADVGAGLPIGMQLVGRPNSEAWLIDLAAPCATPFRWPPVVLSTS